METQRLTKGDEGKVNERLLRRYGAVDLSRIESASRNIPTTLNSPEAKRIFLRHFHMLQVHMHYVSVIARIVLPHEDVEQAEEKMLAGLQVVANMYDHEIAAANKKFIQHGITELGKYHSQPFVTNVTILSAFARRYLELFGKFDHLMLMLEMMAMDEIITLSEQHVRKVRYKKVLAGLSSSARQLNIAFHKQINPSFHKRPMAGDAGAGAGQVNQGGATDGTTASAPVNYLTPEQEAVMAALIPRNEIEALQEMDPDPDAESGPEIAIASRGRREKSGKTSA